MKTLNVKRDDCSDAVLVDRTTDWGNPFAINRNGDRYDVVVKHAAWLARQKPLLARLGELRDRNLACHCAPDLCHADTLRVCARIGEYSRVYAGIGNRFNLPAGAEALMAQVGEYMARRGYVLRSGGAVGADQAFARGAAAVGGVVTTLTANGVRRHPSYERAMELAERFHPAWHDLSEYVRHLMARNGQIVLAGDWMTLPVRYVICWAASEDTGGTSHALRMARYYGLPVYNLARSDVRVKFEQLIRRARWPS